MTGAPRAGNGAAVASLVMGLLLCIPFITGLGGIIFGAVGIKKTKDPRVGGKGLAIAGLVLGIANILLWIVLSGAFWAAYAGTAEQRGIARTFIKDLSEGNVSAAASACHSTVSRASLEQSSKAMQSWGPIQDVTTTGFHANTSTSRGAEMKLTGVARFSTVQKMFIIELVKEGGKWKIAKYEFPS